MNHTDVKGFESLIPLIEQTNVLLPVCTSCPYIRGELTGFQVNGDVACNLPCGEDQQKLLQEVRATRDAFVQEKA